MIWKCFHAHDQYQKYVGDKEVVNRFILTG